MIMVQVGGEYSLGVAGIKYDHAIKALSSWRSDQPFHVGVLPRAPRGNDNLLDAQTRDSPAECFSIYIASRSRTRYLGGRSQGKASTICCAVHCVFRRKVTGVSDG